MTMPVQTIDPTPTPAPAAAEEDETIYPLVTRVITEPMLAPTPVSWAVTQPHPLISTMKILRMFLVEDENGAKLGVNVYSLSQDNKECMRNFLPMRMIRITEEFMPGDVFAEEIAIDEGAEEEPEPTPPS